MELDSLIKKLLKVFEEQNRSFLPEYYELQSKQKTFKVAYTEEFRKYHASIVETLEQGVNPHKTLTEEKALCMCSRLL